MVTCKLRRKVRPLPVWVKKVDQVNLDSRKRTVSFGSVQIREYERIIGAYKCIPNSLALGWDYDQKPETLVNGYKPSQQSDGGLIILNPCLHVFKKLSSSASPSTPKSEKVSPKSTQEKLQILKGFGYTKQELFDAEKERLKKIRHAPHRGIKIAHLVSSVRRRHLQ